MQVGKIRQLMLDMQSALTASPHQILKNKSLQQNYNLSSHSFQCVTCQEFKRQNYALKQQLCKAQEKEEKIWETEKQLQAIRELYDLKCQQASLLHHELLSEQHKNKKIKEKSDQFCEQSIKMLQRGLSSENHNKIQ